MYFVCLCVDGCVLGVVLFCVCVCEGVGRDMHVPGVAPVKHFPERPLPWFERYP